MQEHDSTSACYWHPDRATRLACTQCSRAICVDCSNDAAVGQRCPDHAGSPGRHRIIDARRATRSQSGLRNAPFVKWTMIVTVSIHIIGIVSPDIADWMAGTRVRGGFIPDGHIDHNNAALQDGEIWRMVTHALLHSRSLIWHILFNMYWFYLFGPALERRVGSVPFAGLYVASAAAGSAGGFILGPPNMIAVGASGAMFGLLGAWLYASWRMRSSSIWRQRLNQLAVVLAINLALPLLVPLIAWEAHLGGLVGGLAVAIGWNWWAVDSNKPEMRRTLVAITVLLISVGLVLLV